MRIQIRPTLVFGNKNTKDPAVVDLVWLTVLLNDIDHGKTLMSACKKMGLSYRNGFNLLKTLIKRLCDWVKQAYCTWKRDLPNFGSRQKRSGASPVVVIRLFNKQFLISVALS